MADQNEITETYDWMDGFWGLMFKGLYRDITCAFYNGNYKMSLEEAQKAKWEYILESINFEKGKTYIDIGCGWGTGVQSINMNGGLAKGLTLSPAQAAACQTRNLDVIIQDWKTMNSENFGKGKNRGVISLGAFEHFCSKEQMLSGQQEKIYNDFFKLCSELLEPNGRLFLQSMIWGTWVPDPLKGDLDVNAPKLSYAWILGHLLKFYPGSWLPNNLEQIIKCASPYFKIISSNNGRKDYIQTMKEWGEELKKPSFKKLIYAAKLLPKYLTNKDFRYQITSLINSCNSRCFIEDELGQSIMTHERMVFQKI